MAHRETNPHFLPPEPRQRDHQPLLPGQAPHHGHHPDLGAGARPLPPTHHPDIDPHLLPRQHPDPGASTPRHGPRHHPGPPLSQWSGLAQQPDREPHMQPRHPPRPLGPWGVLAQQQSAPKLKKQKRGKDSQPTPTTPIKKNSHPSGAAAVRVPVPVQPPKPAPPENHPTVVPTQEHQGPHPPPDIPLGNARPLHPRPKFNQQELGPPRHPPYLPKPRRTKLPTWFAAVFCAVFWIIIILGGLAVLVVYLLFRPKSPQFDITNVNLNAAYLDMGYLLNADITLLVNFTNPNKKVRVDFSAMYLDLIFDDTPIATQYIPPFKAAKRQSKFQWIHMIASQVALTTRESKLLQKQIENNRVMIFVRGKFRARSNFGSLLRYSYWIHAYCTLTLSGPPTGVLKGKDCRTKH